MQDVRRLNVFGQSYEDITVTKGRKVLAYFKQSGYSRDPKDTLHLKLIALERMLSRARRLIVGEYLTSSEASLEELISQYEATKSRQSSVSTRISVGKSSSPWGRSAVMHSSPLIDSIESSGSENWRTPTPMSTGESNSPVNGSMDQPSSPGNGTTPVNKPVRTPKTSGTRTCPYFKHPSELGTSSGRMVSGKKALITYSNKSPKSPELDKSPDWAAVSKLGSRDSSAREFGSSLDDSTPVQKRPRTLKPERSRSRSMTSPYFPSPLGTTSSSNLTASPLRQSSQSDGFPKTAFSRSFSETVKPSKIEQNSMLAKAARVRKAEQELARRHAMELKDTSPSFESPLEHEMTSKAPDGGSPPLASKQSVLPSGSISTFGARQATPSLFCSSPGLFVSQSEPPSFGAQANGNSVIFGQTSKFGMSASPRSFKSTSPFGGILTPSFGLARLEGQTPPQPVSYNNGKAEVGLKCNSPRFPGYESEDLYDATPPRKSTVASAQLMSLPIRCGSARIELEKHPLVPAEHDASMKDVANDGEDEYDFADDVDLGDDMMISNDDEMALPNNNININSDNSNNIVTGLSRICDFCLEDLSSNSFAETPYDIRCKHAVTTCKTCSREYVRNKIRGRTATRLNCSDRDCPVILSYEAVQKMVISGRIFKEYALNNLEQILDSDPTYVRCLQGECSNGQFHEGGDAMPIVTCEACGAKSCFTHKVPWHIDRKCNNNNPPREDKESEAASTSLISQTAKICPGKRCGHAVEKKDVKGDCDHMTCISCKHQFCFECLAAYDGIRARGNAEHLVSCKYHSNKIRARYREDTVDVEIHYDRNDDDYVEPISRRRKRNA